MRAGLAEFKREFQSIIDYFKNNKFLIIIISFFALLAYGLPLTQYSLSIDEEHALLRSGEQNLSVWTSQGRYGISSLKWLFHLEKSNSITSTFLAITLLGLASLLWAYIISNYSPDKKAQKNDSKGIIVASLFFTFPAYAENIGFSMMSFELGVGWVLTALSVLFITRWAVYDKNRLYMFISIVLIMFVTSIYQAFLPVIICGCMFVALLALSQQYKEKVNSSYSRGLIIVLKFILTILLGLIVYKIIDKTLGIFIPSSPYINNFVAWGTQSPGLIMKNLLRHFEQYVQGNTIYGSGILLPTFAFNAIIILIYMWRIVIHKELRGIGVSLAILCFGFLSTPFLMSVFLGTPLLIRMDLVCALFVGCTWVFLYLAIEWRKIKFLVLSIAILFSFYQSISISQLFFSDYSRYQEDINLANQIGSEIQKQTGSESPKQAIAFIGQHPQPLLPNIIKQEVLGFSFFEWDQGNPGRMNSFLNTLGYNFILASPDQMTEAIELAKEMPVWPESGSIALKHGIVIVNLSASSLSSSIKISPDKINSQVDKIIYSYSPQQEDIEFTNDLSLRNQENHLVLNSGVTDPYVSFFNKYSPLNTSIKYITLEFTSDIEGEIQIFLRQSDEEFNESNSGRYNVIRGTNLIYCKVPSDFKDLKSIRLDPPSTSEFTQIHIKFYE
ncbi:glucosyltransferase domain-containing protein [Cohnella sp. GCM10020058]|uniref:glucosyltransferase domain-containing protein n=1 Tax=Cohnella sp. GCM10020058 TaxID=3317330 RepID=UPI00363A3870